MKIRNVGQCKWVVPDPTGSGFKVLHPNAVVDVNDKSHPVLKKLAENYPQNFISIDDTAPKKAKAVAE